MHAVVELYFTTELVEVGKTKRTHLIHRYTSTYMLVHAITIDHS